jgi:hypothetical protein
MKLLVLITIWITSIGIKAEESFQYTYALNENGKQAIHGHFEKNQPVVFLYEDQSNQCRGFTGEKGMHSDEATYFKITEIMNHNCEVEKSKLLALVGKTQVDYKIQEIRYSPKEEGERFLDIVKKENIFRKYLNNINDNAYWEEDGSKFVWTEGNLKEIKIRNYFTLIHKGVPIEILHLSYKFIDKKGVEWNFDKGPVIYLVNGKPHILNGIYSRNMLYKVFYIDDGLFVKDASGCYGCGAYASLIEKFDGEKFNPIYFNSDWQTLK